MEKNHIEMSSEIYEALMDLRKIMFQNVYTHPEAKEEEQKAIKMLKKLYAYYIENPEEMSRGISAADEERRAEGHRWSVIICQV